MDHATRTWSTVRSALALGALLVLLSLTALQLQAGQAAARANRASDGATILALAGVRAFAQQTEAQALMEIPLGADSMVMKARVFFGEQTSGTYAVRVAKVGASAFRLKSTGRLVAGGRATMCSVDVFIQLDARQSQPSLGVEQEPLCNGSRHRSAVTSVRNIGT
jgi:hypothetical protein